MPEPALGEESDAEFGKDPEQDESTHHVPARMTEDPFRMARNAAAKCENEGGGRCTGGIRAREGRTPEPRRPARVLT